MIDFYNIVQKFFENHSDWLTFLSFAVPVLNTLFAKVYGAITRKAVKTSLFPIFLMFLISSLILFFLINSENELDHAMIAIISSNTVVVVFLILAFLLGNQKINAVQFAKAKHGVFDINYLD